MNSLFRPSRSFPPLLLALIATALFHAVGISIGLFISRMGQVHTVRFAGGAIALFGAYLCLG